MQHLKTYLAALLLVGVASSAGAQQLPQFSHFTYNYINYNPAVTGYTNCLELRMGYRGQWAGFEGAPKTGFANAHAKFGKKKFNYHGIGGYVENDNVGPFAYTSFHLNYAYHMKVGRKFYLSAGVGVGFMQYRIDFGKIDMEQQNIDPVITGSISEFIFPTINAGIWLYKANQYYGISTRSVNSHEIPSVTTSEIRRHWTFAYGRAIRINDEMMFKPAFLMNYVGRSKASLEGQAAISYKEKFSLGIGARGGYGFSAMIKIDTIPFVSIAYAYDITANRIRYVAANSHEIVLGIKACPGKEHSKEPCAAYD